MPHSTAGVGNKPDQRRCSADLINFVAPWMINLISYNFHPQARAGEPVSLEERRNQFQERWAALMAELATV